ncbi:MAG: rRNA pseudouridine synthase [Sedimentisphaerales bacterium]|nr:rRNA pseudouridine synthase [Sedimentisphaerales bacterium]
MAEQRLQKVLAAAGVDSRRRCEELILDGEVRVNGKVVDTLPSFVDPDVDEIKVGGRKIRFAPRVYYALNKPKGAICTSSDPQGRKKAIDLIPTKERIFCVGRLDVDSSGLIILTNDNDLANKLTHPKYKLPKTYRVEVKGQINTEAVEKLKKGIWLAEGKTAESSVKILRRGHNVLVLEIKISQGLNRQIRRMLANVGLKVKSLKRTKIGRIDIRGLGVGRYRSLSKAEVSFLKKIDSR